MKSKDQRQCLIILGMHRSGTSAITRVLNLLGADLGKELLPPANDNPKGFWENKRILEIHEQLLAVLGSSYDDVRPLPDGWWKAEKVAPYKKALMSVLEDDFASSTIFAVKDARISILLPLWLEIFKELNIVPKFILCLRHPSEIAASLLHRNGYPYEKSYLLWLGHMLAAEYWTRNHPRIFISYDELLADWKATVAKITKKFSIPWKHTPQSIEKEVRLFLDPSLRHHRAKDEKLLPLFSKVYRALVAKSKDDNVDISIVCDKAKEELNTIYMIVKPIPIPLGAMHDGVARYCQLFVDTGSGLSEKQSIKIQVLGNERQVEFDVSVFQNIKALRFDPLNDLCVIKFFNITIVKAGNLVQQFVPFRTNAVLQVGNIYVFDMNDPQVWIESTEVLNVMKLIVDLEFLAIGDKTHGYIAQYKDEQFRKLQADLVQRDQLLEHFIIEAKLKNDALKQKDEVLRSKDAELKQKDEDLRQVNDSINKLLEQQTRMEVKLMQKDCQNAEQGSRIRELNEELNQSAARLREKEAVILDLSGKINQLQAQVKAKDGIIAEKENAYQSLLNEFVYIKSTLSYSIGRIITAPFAFVYDLLVKFFSAVDRKVGKSIWPPGTKRAVIMNALLHLRQTLATSTYLLRVHGIKAFLQAVNEALRGGNFGIEFRNIQSPIAPVQVKKVELKHTTISVVPTDEGVSVVIPTLNGSDDLVKLLPALNNQKGFKRIEIIIVDSGSTDDTITLSKGYGAKVIQIDPKEFSHSRARNIGAENAAENYVLFMVQDALPPTDTWLYQMFTFLKREKVAAVSCMEMPRIEADLFSRVENWYHYKKFLELDNADKILSKPQSKDPAVLRQTAQISDVACLIPKDIFLKYKFRGEYAKDLDLGLRLTNDGHKLGLLSSTCVIHSHTREPFYYLKRGYVDKLVISQLTNEQLGNTGVEYDAFVQDVFFTYDILLRLDTELFDAYTHPSTLEHFCQQVSTKMRAMMDQAYPSRIEIRSHDIIDEQSMAFLTKLYDHYHHPPAHQRGQKILLPAILVFYDIAFEYMRQTYEVVNDQIIRDFRSLTYIYYMNLIGRYLAVCYSNDKRDSRKEVQEIHKELAFKI